MLVGDHAPTGRQDVPERCREIPAFDARKLLGRIRCPGFVGPTVRSHGPDQGECALVLAGPGARPLTLTGIDYGSSTLLPIVMWCSALAYEVPYLYTLDLSVLYIYIYVYIYIYIYIFLYIYIHRCYIVNLSGTNMRFVGKGLHSGILLTLTACRSRVMVDLTEGGLQ